MLDPPLDLCYAPVVVTPYMTGSQAIMPRPSRVTGRLLAGALLLAELIPGTLFASPLDQLSDLSGKVSVTVTLIGRDNFNSEYRYDLTVRNRSGDPFIADSLIVVLDKITNLAGEEREPLKNEPLLHRFEVVGQDGETEALGGEPAPDQDHPGNADDGAQ